jgi:hypothetical protein
MGIKKTGTKPHRKSKAALAAGAVAGTAAYRRRQARTNTAPTAGDYAAADRGPGTTQPL